MATPSVTVRVMNARRAAGLDYARLNLPAICRIDGVPQRRLGRPAPANRLAHQPGDCRLKVAVMT
jgi:hypothetical protein